ncbi:MAG: YqeG family HAD IIIA-type phosphatase [Lachnospiraceae bacterium]
MVEQFYPSECIDSTYQIDFAQLYQDGIRGVLFDIDNTLVPHGAPADERAMDLFAYLRQIGMNCCVISNNKEPRVKSFADAVGAEYIFKADKPSKRGYLKAMEQMGTNKDTTVFVGDQLFTDVWGARRCGIYSILVKPIHPREEIQIVLKRYLEKVVLYFYNRSLGK